jgi:galactonate dehydratase
MTTNTQSRRSFIAKSAITAALSYTALSGFGNGLERAVDRTPLASSPSDLKITEIKCGYIRNGHSLFVKVHSNQGIWGCGEGVDATPGTYHLVKMMGERIKGKSPLNVHRLFEDIRRSGFFEGAQSGMFVSVLSAVETALWDLAGKALNLPVYQLLGGKFRDKILRYRFVSIKVTDAARVRGCGAQC